MLEIWAHTLCLTYHFIDKSFLRHFSTNEPSNHPYKSGIPLAKPMYFDSLVPHLLTLYHSEVWKLKTSNRVLFSIVQKRKWAGKFYVIKFYLTIEKSWKKAIQLDSLPLLETLEILETFYIKLQSPIIILKPL